MAAVGWYCVDDTLLYGEDKKEMRKMIKLSDYFHIGIGVVLGY